MSVVDSVKLHGKLWFNEDDTRTHIAGPEAGNFGRAYNIEETLALLKRNFCNVMIKEVGEWWSDNTGGWYNHPQIVKCIAKMRKIMKFSQKFVSPIKGITIILDDKSLLYQKPGDELTRPLITKQVSCEYGRIGTPYHLYLVDDLKDPSMPDYKLYIFLNTFHLSSEQRKIIKQRVQVDGKTIVWMYAPGFVNKDLSLKNSFDLTGIKLSLENIESDLHINITNFEHPITKELSKNTRFGTDNYIGPVFYCSDPDAITLGNLTYKFTIVKPGFCIKEFKDWTSIYIAAPYVPSNVLRGIAKFSGVHIFSEGEDILYVNRDSFLYISDTLGLEE